MKKLQKNWLEWVVFAISLVLVITTLGYLVYDGATFSETPPDIELELGKAQAQATDRFIIPVTASNRGDMTAKPMMSMTMTILWM